MKNTTRTCLIAVTLAVSALGLGACSDGYSSTSYSVGVSSGYPSGGYRDRDGDGVPNRFDRDRDGDGVPNAFDRRPGNPYRE